MTMNSVARIHNHKCFWKCVAYCGCSKLWPVPHI